MVVRTAPAVLELRHADVAEARVGLLELVADGLGADLATFVRFEQRGSEVYYSDLDARGDPDFARDFMRLEGRPFASPTMVDPRFTPRAQRNRVHSWSRDVRRPNAHRVQPIWKLLLEPHGFSDHVRLTAFRGDRHIGYVAAMYRDRRRLSTADLRRAAGWREFLLSGLDAVHGLRNLEPSLRLVFDADGQLEFREPNAVVPPEVPLWVKAAIRRVELGQRYEASRSGYRLALTRLHRFGSGSRYLAEVARAHEPSSSPFTDRLPPRQAQVAHAAAAGDSVAEIAATLDLSPHTVKRHLAAVYERLGVGSRAELSAIRSGGAGRAAPGAGARGGGVG